MTVGMTGLFGEGAFLAFILRTGVWGATLWDRLLTEIAAAGFTYGSILAVLILARLKPDLAFPPRKPYQSEADLRHRARILLAIALVLLAFEVGFQLVLLVIGLSRPLEAAESILHAYPIIGMMFSLPFFIWNSLARGPIPNAQ